MEDAVEIVDLVEVFCALGGIARWMENERVSKKAQIWVSVV